MKLTISPGEREPFLKIEFTEIKWEEQEEGPVHVLPTVYIDTSSSSIYINGNTITIEEK